MFLKRPFEKNVKSRKSTSM